ncbi:phosphopantetheine-binding protein [Leuconostoc suionicum]|nr:phosphopantetheine-binding protein [Leuconostoc suionicum]MDI6498626.1 phosphopantetheine-binding protein [Leuconostoc suionicum]MDI6500668.1 phosphopantetheine-binding protein [Leuconostoc suionicum]MDI6502792.1 phosphopantetheine-binding protein [Leuconostoc suionicum]MDI6523598.1 phosphopantetheine-binding protein [Leuconostoc suionicum]MDI6613294.1 phosphopantetheine-binding protein [Leuconostoc suionicum]
MNIQEIKHLIKAEVLINRLELEDVSVEDIGDDDNLYSENGLALDSVEALDIVDGIAEVFNVNVETVMISGEDNNFQTVNEIANYILKMEQ